jgi:hypothetical protein
MLNIIILNKMPKKLHWVVVNKEGIKYYICNKGFAVRRKRTAHKWEDVDCTNCKRVRTFLENNNLWMDK